MAPKATEWVHGTVVDVEEPGELASISNDGIARRGWGTHFWGQEDTYNWFHIPVTTPVISDGQIAKLTKLFVLYETKGNAKIKHVHLYDGKQKKKSFNDLNLSGDHGSRPDSSNTWIINPPLAIQYGLGLSICVNFGNKGGRNVWPEVVFSSAGAEFENI
jgi:hypothetical protein